MKITSLLFVLALAPLCTPASSAPAAKPKTAKPKAAKPAPAVWKLATNAQRVAAAASIRAQLEAFKRDDWARAATYQSEALRRNLGTPAKFRAMMETTYPQFANYKTVTFEQARALGDIVQIQVRLTGQDGVKLRAIYTMKKEKGVYRVDGVQGGSTAPRGMQEPADYV